MSEAHPADHPSRFSGLVLTFFTLWMLLLRPGELKTEGPYGHLFLFGSLAGAYALYLVFWKTHGALYSLIVCTIFILSDRRMADHQDEAFWQLAQIILLAIVGLNMIAWSELDKEPKLSAFWLIGDLGLIILAAFLWIEIGSPSSHLSAHLNEPMATSNRRIIIFAFVMMLAGGVLGFKCSERKSACAWSWLAGSFLAPVAGFGVARLFASVELEQIIKGGRWDRLGADLVNWCSQPELRRNSAGWCWTTPWLVIALMLVGTWRAVARGFRQRKQGIMPLAWLTLLAAILLAAGLLPAASESPIGLLWLGIALSIFAVADLLLLLFEQLALPAPQPGPSGVPHV